MKIYMYQKDFNDKGFIGPIKLSNSCIQYSNNLAKQKNHIIYKDLNDNHLRILNDPSVIKSIKSIFNKDEITLFSVQEMLIKGTGLPWHYDDYDFFIKNTDKLFTIHIALTESFDDHCLELEKYSHKNFNQLQTYKGLYSRVSNNLTQYIFSIIILVVFIFYSDLFFIGKVSSSVFLIILPLILFGIDLLIYYYKYNIRKEFVAFSQGIGLDSKHMPFHVSSNNSEKIILKPSEFIIFNNYLLHKSVTNNKSKSRSILVLRFATGNPDFVKNHYHVCKLHKLKGNSFVSLEDN